MSHRKPKPERLTLHQLSVAYDEFLGRGYSREDAAKAVDQMMLDAINARRGTKFTLEDIGYGPGG